MVYILKNGCGDYLAAVLFFLVWRLSCFQNLRLYIKKRLSSRQPIFVNLKSNTMKNTLQMYEHYLYMQYYYSTKCNILTMINYLYIKKSFYKTFFYKKSPFIQYIMPSDFYNRHKYRYAIFSILHPLSIMLMPDVEFR